MVVPVFLTVLLVAALAGPLGQQPAGGAETMQPADAVAGTDGGAAAGGTGGLPSERVVVIGVPGLRWNDVDPDSTPTLWRFVGSGSAAALSIRTVSPRTCPIDGWLTVSAGQRANLAYGNCALPPAPTRTGESAAVPGFDRMREDNANGQYEARLGLLGDAVRRAGGCTMAVGPGAVLGAADSAGRVDAYVPSAGQLPARGWARCPLTVVDVDDVFRAYIDAGVDVTGVQNPVSRRERTVAASRADQRVAEVLTRLPARTTVLIAGLSDTATEPHLHVAMATGPTGDGGRYGSTYLTALSTRRPGLVTLTDVTSTVLRTLDIAEPAAAIGAAWTPGRAKPGITESVRALDDQDVAAQAIRRMSPSFFVVLVLGQLVLYGAIAAVLRRRWGGDRVRDRVRDRVLWATRLVAIAGAAVPVSTFLANIVPWWHFTHPLLALIASLLGAVTILTALALGGPWRRSITAACLVIAGVTALVLAFDVMTGSRLQLDSFMGYSPLVAGRFYGFGNMAFAIFATASLFTAAMLAERPLRSCRPRPAIAIIVVIGALAVAIDGWPQWGSDFGGVIAIVAGTAVLALLATGRKVSLTRMALIIGVGVGVVGVIAFADALRPAAEQTHLGRFWEQLWTGDAWGVIARKAQAMLRSLGYWPFTIIAAAGLSFLFFVLSRPLQWRAAVLERAYAYAPTLRPALIAMLVAALLGMVVNDSGVVIPALALTLAIPLALAAGVRALELDERGAGSALPEPEASRSAPTG